MAFAREKKILASPEGHRQTGARSGPRLTLGHVPQKSRWSAVLRDLPSASPFCSGENTGIKREALPLELVV